MLLDCSRMRSSMSLLWLKALVRPRAYTFRVALVYHVLSVLWCQLIFSGACTLWVLKTSLLTPLSGMTLIQPNSYDVCGCVIEREKERER